MKKSILFILCFLFLLVGCSLSLNDIVNNQNQNNSENDDNDIINEVYKKQLYCQYVDNINFENAREGLRIYIPTYKGYINYNFVHSINSTNNYDIWRLGLAYTCDDYFENYVPITTMNAEWDMAIRLSGRPDFIGGSAHGDEIFTDLYLSLNYKNIEILSLTKLTPFNDLRLYVNSKGYDPNDSTTHVLNHYKEYLITNNGITLNQKVEFLVDDSISQSYLAMLPPLKSLTHTLVANDEEKSINLNKTSITINNCNKAVVYGNNLSFEMSVSKYPTNNCDFLLTDNSGGSYNKMYFIIKSQSISKNQIITSSTHYSISNKY